jgi:hypothetical protein
MVCGVDPGLGGALAFDTEDGLTVHDMPLRTAPQGDREVDPHAFLRLLCHYGASHIFIEAVGTFGHEGHKSLWTFAEAYATAYGCLRAYEFFRPADVSVTRVPVQAWQFVMHDGLPKAVAPKERSGRRAKELYPGIDLKGPRGGYKDGRADAALIMAYGVRRVSNGK